eukprot:4547803-Lingulodinium_polyedra.AAC.1
MREPENWRVRERAICGGGRSVGVACALFGCCLGAASALLGCCLVAAWVRRLCPLGTACVLLGS